MRKKLKKEIIFHIVFSYMVQSLPGAYWVAEGWFETEINNSENENEIIMNLFVDMKLSPVSYKRNPKFSV